MIIYLWYVVIIYALGLMTVLRKWGSIQSENSAEEKIEYHKFSVLIPIRNEASNISVLLQELDLQIYPKDKFEVIVINDHSTDDSLQVIHDLKPKLQCSLRLIQLPDKCEGKKAALKEGISQASGDIIVTTDGDCRVYRNWLNTFNIAFQNSATKMAFGGVSYITENRLLHALQAMELCVLVAVGAVMNKMEWPSMCNGANLAFHKKKFLELGGYSGNEHIPTGDDEFLLRKFYKDASNSISFIKAWNNVVLTNPVNTWGELIQQKIRWASKWKQHKDWITWVMALFIFIANMTFIGLIILGINGNINFIEMTVLYGVKVLADVLLISRMLSWFGDKKPIRMTIVFSIVYPIYAVVVGVLSSFGNYRWKGRNY